MDHEDIKDFLEEIWVFRYGALLVRGIYTGTRRRTTKVSFIYRIGPDVEKCYNIDTIRFLSMDIAPWCSEEQRLQSLGEFNETHNSRLSRL